MTIRAWPMLQSGKLDTQSMRITVNDEEVGSWSLDRNEPQERKFMIPRQDANAGNCLQVIFDLSEATTPRSLGIGNDERTLSVAFVQVQLKP